MDGCLLLTRETRQVYVDAGDIRCRCPAFAAGAGCRYRRALAETMRSELAGLSQRHDHARTYAEVVGSPTKALPAPAGGHLHLPLQRRPACGTLASGIPLTPREVAVGAGGESGRSSGRGSASG